VIVSLGMDAHFRDQLANMQLYSRTYGMLASRAKQLADKYAGGRLLYCLEGGYDLRALEESVAETVCALTGEYEHKDDPFEHERPPNLPDEPDITGVIEQAKAIHFQS